jgi:hypothetical protein
MRTRILIVIPAALQAAANAFALQFDPTGGDKTFQVPLFASETEQGEPSHYWCSVSITPATVEAVQQNIHLFPGAQVFEYDLTEQPQRPSEARALLGLFTMKGVTP